MKVTNTNYSMLLVCVTVGTSKMTGWIKTVCKTRQMFIPSDYMFPHVFPTNIGNIQKFALAYLWTVRDIKLDFRLNCCLFSNAVKLKFNQNASIHCRINTRGCLRVAVEESQIKDLTLEWYQLAYTSTTLHRDLRPNNGNIVGMHLSFFTRSPNDEVEGRSGTWKDTKKKNTQTCKKSD